MAGGQPLDDADRAPWLQAIREQLLELEKNGQCAVFACSALKQAYRLFLAAGIQQLHFVYLHGPFDLIYARLQERQDHYMSAEMLQSQFETLEPPAPGEAFHVEISAPVEEIVTHILARLPGSPRAEK